MKMKTIKKLESSDYTLEHMVKDFLGLLVMVGIGLALTIIMFSA
jgi:hypothetical protein